MARSSCTRITLTGLTGPRALEWTASAREALAESRKSADLLQDAQDIAHATVFHNLPPGDAEQRHAHRAEWLAGGGYAQHGAGMGAGNGDEGRHAIPLGNQLLNG